LQEFKIGYAPSHFDGLTRVLKKKGFTDDELKRAGLSTYRGRGLSDMFRGRIMVPLMDPQGVAIGFTARILQDEPNAPKYLNTPQTLLYDKSRHVYGLSQAKQAIRAASAVVMVEGNLDVIASHQAGVKFVVATAGTALTESHLKTLSRFTDDIRIAFDQDAAGLRATERAVGLAAGVGIKLSVVDVPEGKDPDELVRKSPKLWEESVARPVYSIDWLRSYHQKAHNVSSAEGKRAYTDAMLRVIGLVKDPVEREHYLKTLAKDVDASLEAMNSKFEQRPNEEKRLKAPKVATEPTTDQDAYQDQLLGLLLVHTITRRVLETVDDEPIFAKPERQEVFEYIALHPHDTFDGTIPEGLQNIEDYVKIITLLAEELYATFDANERLREAQDLVRRLTKDYKKLQRQKLSSAIREAESRGDDTSVQDLLAKFNDSYKEDKE
jgi:DNA primase